VRETETHQKTLSGLAGLELPSRPGVACVSAAENGHRFVVRGPGEMKGVIQRITDVATPAYINLAASVGTTSVLMLGPDEWLLLVAPDHAQSIWEAFLRESTRSPCAVVDVTSRDVGLIIDGPLVEGVLNAACPLALDTRAFPPGRATRTLLGKATIILWRQSDGRFHVETGRSFAPYVVGLLAQAIRSETPTQVPS
jgi:sarcosine oxidase subunit gamma